GQIGASGVQAEAISQQLIAVLQEKEDPFGLCQVAVCGLGLIGGAGINVEIITQQLIAVLQEKENDAFLSEPLAAAFLQIIAADINSAVAFKILALLWQDSSISKWRHSRHLTDKGKGYLLHCLGQSTQPSVQPVLDDKQVVACLAEIFSLMWSNIDSLLLHIYRSHIGDVKCQLGMTVAGKIWFPDWLLLKPKAVALLLEALQQAAAEIGSTDKEQANIKRVKEQLTALTKPPAQPIPRLSPGAIIMTSHPFWYTKENTDLKNQYKQLKAFLMQEVKLYLTTNFKIKPCIAISYAWDIPEHEKGVEHLARFLEAAGMEVLLDKWAIKGNADIGTFIEKMFTKAHRLLVIGTPLYLTKYNQVKDNQEQPENQLLTLMQAMTPSASEHVLRFEARILLRLCIAGESISNRIYPIIWSGQRHESLPFFLNTKIGYPMIDEATQQTDVTRCANELFKLIRDIYGIDNRDKKWKQLIKGFPLINQNAPVQQLNVISDKQIAEKELVNQNKNNQSVTASHKVAAEQQAGALVQVQGRAERARAIAFGMPAAVSIDREG
ncbi:MAG: toll/interleukin-1 receptor domain-containing protein, partial [Gammaproteobacteria bacterium]